MTKPKERPAVFAGRAGLDRTSGTVEISIERPPAQAAKASADSTAFARKRSRSGPAKPRRSTKPHDAPRDDEGSRLTGISIIRPGDQICANLRSVMLAMDRLQLIIEDADQQPCGPLSFDSESLCWAISVVDAVVVWSGLISAPTDIIDYVRREFPRSAVINCKRPYESLWTDFVRQQKKATAEAFVLRTTGPSRIGGRP